MASFLFWNLYGRAQKNRDTRMGRLRASIVRLAAAHALDVLIFAECAIESADMVASLNGTEGGPYYAVPGGSRRLRFFSRLPDEPWTEMFHDPVSDRLAIQELRIGTGPTILLAAVHCFDRDTIPTSAGRAFAAEDIASDVRETEQEVNHNRTVLVGDLNMNPFEEGVVGARAFHGVMSRELARTLEHGRMRRRARYPCFYNPMWACFGDRSPGPSGSYFFPNATDPTNHFWNVYDQVLLRPELMDTLVDVRILDNDGHQRLVTQAGRPRKATFSDHLPLLFTLEV